MRNIANTSHIAKNTSKIFDFFVVQPSKWHKSNRLEPQSSKLPHSLTSYSQSISGHIWAQFSHIHPVNWGVSAHEIRNKSRRIYHTLWRCPHHKSTQVHISKQVVDESISSIEIATNLASIWAPASVKINQDLSIACTGKKAPKIITKLFTMFDINLRKSKRDDSGHLAKWLI